MTASVTAAFNGDYHTGKTTFMLHLDERAKNDTGWNDYKTSVSHRYKLDEKELLINLTLYTAGPNREDSDRLRSLSYYPGHCDLIVTFCSVDRPHTLENVRAQWEPEVHRVNPALKIILIVNKSDLWDNTAWIEENKQIAQERGRPWRMSTREEAETLAQEIGAVKYFIFSATTASEAEYKEVVDEIVRVAMDPSNHAQPQGKHRGKCILQ